MGLIYYIYIYSDNKIVDISSVSDLIVLTNLKRLVLKFP